MLRISSTVSCKWGGVEGKRIVFVHVELFLPSLHSYDARCRHHILLVLLHSFMLTVLFLSVFGLFLDCHVPLKDDPSANI